VFTSVAAAAAPVKTSFSFEDVPAVMTGVCQFPVAVSSDVTGTEIDYFDASGSLTRVFLHTTEQDTFTANGKSIAGEPYTFNLEILFDAAGNVVHAYASGPAARAVLPDGTLFLSAGRGDFAQHPGVAFLLSPDVGNPGDVAAFCAALA
jgi:hypothetical protein